MTKKKKYALMLIPAILIAAILFLFIINKTGSISQYPNANVILIVVDTLRADHLGCYGYSRNTSPEIDKLAKEGIIFKNMFAQSSWTKPSTVSILSGLYPQNHGANTHKGILSGEVNLLSEILDKHGYRSYAFVANSIVSGIFGFEQGFKKFFILKKEVNKRIIHSRSDGVNKTLLPFLQQLEDTSNNFIYIHYIDPHEPYTPKEKHFSKSNKITFSNDFFHSGVFFSMNEVEQNKAIKEMIDAYDDEILYNDKMIGKLIKTLKEKNMYSNSIIIITSDHGEEFFEHGGFLHGRSLYGELLKVPLIIRLPDKINKTIDKIANQVDILPTILALLEIPIPNGIDGIDLLNNKKAPNLFSYAELSTLKSTLNLSSIRTSKYKLIEGVAFPLQKKTDFRWFGDKAIIKINDDSLELIIRSFYKDRTIQILSDGKPIEDFVITTKKQTFNITLPGANRKKTVTIKSLTPCQVPKHLGINNDMRCLAFGIFNSSNVNYRNLFNEIYKEYYTLADDPGENNNKYNQHKCKKTIMKLRKKLKRYLTSKRGRLNKKPVKYSKEQIEALKALGYIN